MIESTRTTIARRHEHVSDRLRLLTFSFAITCITLALGMGWLKVRIEIIGHEQVAVFSQINAHKSRIEEMRRPDYRFYRDI